ncbi:MAG: type II toxin-antitoxin system mRNA interferase toxin, RelE/StbE family [Candidatus Jacksonbacteria bacterium]
MIVKFHKNFKKIYYKAPPRLQEAVNEKMALFYQNSFHPLLNNHQLKGKYKDHRSVNITGDWRALYKEIDRDYFKFLLLDTHSNLYK